MRLQEVLKERETEISMLEESLRRASQDGLNPLLAHGTLADEMVLSPTTTTNFAEVRRRVEKKRSHNVTSSMSSSEPDDSLERLNELML